MKKSLFLFALLMLTFCVSAFSQNYDQKKKELLKLCKTKVLVEDLDNYIRRSTSSEIAVTVTNVTDKNIVDLMRAVNCSKKPVSIVLSANQGFTKIPDDFLFVSDKDSCFGLRNILLPSTIKSIGAGAFRNCKNLEYVLLQGKNPELETIGKGAFVGCKSLRYLELPAGLKEMDLAFAYGNQSLESVTLPNCVTKIGAYAFCYCTGLTSITIPESVTEIGEFAFGGCLNLASIIIPDGVKYIFSSVFECCTSLASITIPESVTEISENAFKGCVNLTSITIPDGVKLILWGAFQDCSSLTFIEIPQGVKRIYGRTFAGCSSLTSISLPKNLEYVAYNAFEGCSLLKLLIPDNANWHDYKYDKGHLISITIPEGVTEIDFNGCTSLESVTIPEGVTVIGGHAFEGCASLTSITIPESVTNIGWGAFKGCTSLASIVIPKNLTGLKEDVFSGCIGLTDVIIENKDFKFDIVPFMECRSIKSVMINGKNVFAKYYKNDNGKIVDNEKLPPISVHIENMNSDSTISKSNLKLLKEIGISTGDDEYDEYLKRHIRVTIGLTIDGWYSEYLSNSTTLNPMQKLKLNRVAIGDEVQFKIGVGPLVLMKYITKNLKVVE